MGGGTTPSFSAVLRINFATVDHFHCSQHIKAGFKLDFLYLLSFTDLGLGFLGGRLRMGYSGFIVDFFIRGWNGV